MDIEREDSFRRAIRSGYHGDGSKKSGAKDFPAASNPSGIADLRQEFAVDEHRIPAEQLARCLATSLTQGLTEEEATDRLEADGINELEPPPAAPVWVRVAKSALSGFSLLLLVAAVLCFIAYAVRADMSAPTENLYIGFLLLLVVALNTGFAFYLENGSQHMADGFKERLPQCAIVTRSGRRRRLPTTQLVPGDLVHITAGDWIPADVRILSAQRFRVDNSALTGDAQPCKRSADYTSEAPLETENLAFYGTYAVEGSCKALVVRTGPYTLAGRVANLAAEGLADPSTSDTTAIAREIHRFMNLMAGLALVAGLAFFAAAFAMQYDWLQAVLLCMGVVAACLPEALPATATVCLTLAARQMAARGCYPRSLEAVEGLGLCSAVCVGKTGTLTSGRMAVSHTWHSGRTWDTGAGEWSSVKSTDAGRMFAGRDWPMLARCIALCSRADFCARGDASDVAPGNGVAATGSVNAAVDVGEGTMVSPRKVGVACDPTEAALLQFADWTATTCGVEGGVEGIRRRYRKICEVPFNSESRFQVSVHSIPKTRRSRANPNGSSSSSSPNSQHGSVSTNGYFLVLKGAPETVLKRCSSFLCEGRELPLSEQWRQAVSEACTELAALGERVLAFCDLSLDAEDFPPGYAFDADEVNFPLSGLRFLGLVSLMDPLRPGAAAAVAKCRTAGIKVIMTTGDHPITAKALSRQLGIISSRSKTPEDIAAERGVDVARVNPIEAEARIVRGAELDKMSPGQLDAIVSRHAELVFARTSPQQRLRVVQSCQRLGHTVAVTGGRVNDCDTLRCADIGLATGSGCDLARETAANAVLADDSFVTLVSGIEEGRRLLDNLRKSVAYTLTSNVPQMMPFLLYLLWGIPLPLGAVTVLCIDLGTDLAPAASLAFETVDDDDVMRESSPPSTSSSTKTSKNSPGKLIDDRLLGFAFAHAGMLQAAGGLFAYFAVMAENGFWPRRLFGLRQQWDSEGVLDIEDSYGQEWAYWQRKHLEQTAHAAVFASIVVTQWANLLANRSRSRSLLLRGMHNHRLTVAMVASTVLAVLLVYCPGLNWSLQMQPLRFTWWLPSISFGFLLLAWEEARKWMAPRLRWRVLQGY